MRILAFILAASALAVAQWVNLPYPVTVPDTGAYAGISQQSCLMDNSGEYAVMATTVPATGNITHVVIRTGTVTTSQSLTITLETVGSDGNASGTMYGGSTAGTLGSVASNTYYEVALGTAASATAGDLVAVKVAFTSTVGNVNITSVSSSSVGNGYLYCYTGTLNKYQSAPFIRFRYDSAYPIGTVHPALAVQISFASNSATNLYGNQFTIGNPVRVIGLATWALNIAAGGYRLHLRDSAGNVIATALRDIDGDQSTGQFVARVGITPTILSAGTYMVTMEPLSTGTHGYFYWSHYSEQYLRQSDTVPSNWVHCERTSGGSWSTNSARVGLIGIVVDQVWSPSGGFAVSQ